MAIDNFFLSPGDSIAAVSPAGPVDPQEVLQGINALHAEGFKIIRFPNALKHGQYLAGSDLHRVSDLHNAFEDTSISAILCTRGGYGSMRLLPLIDYSLIRANPKPFIGFSDISALQYGLWKEAELVTFSGPQLAKGWGGNLSYYSQKMWLDMLSGNLIGKPLPLPKGKQKLEIKQTGKTEGHLLGGNLAVLSALCGTPHSPEFKDAVVILEEIDEPPYRLDRMITQLEQSGAFKGVKGFVVGGFVQHQNDDVLDWAQLAVSLLSAIAPDVPFVYGAPYSHVGDCWTIPLGGLVELDATEGTLTVKEAG